MKKIPIADLKKYKKIRKIGIGSFGIVYLILDIQTSIKYVAKISYKVKINSKKNAFIREILAYSKTTNPSILPIYAYSPKDFKEKDHPTIILEYMKNGSLCQILRGKREKLKEITGTKKFIILLGIALGMIYLHSQGIIHRDIKAENILLDKDLYPKIADFGASFISDAQLSTLQMKGGYGTPWYLAPEILQKKSYSYQVDIYAFSFIAYELITGVVPFEEYRDNSKLFKDVQKGIRPDLNVINNSNIRDFLKKCWSNEPSERPSFGSIVKELLTDKYKKFFNVDENELSAYLNHFNEHLKHPNLYRELNLKKSAEKGNLKSMFLYSAFLIFGIGSEINNEEGNKYLKMAADGGEEDAMHFYALKLKLGFNIDKNIKESIRYFIKSSEKGNVESMIEYGNMLLNGDGIAVNQKKAAHYYRLAANKGNNIAMYSYALMLLKGVGTSVNNKEAAHYFKLLADNAFGNSAFIYGVMLYLGCGIGINKKDAAFYLKKSAEQNNKISMFFYAYMLLNGDGIEMNKEEAARYFKKSAKLGFIYSWLFYGLMLYFGDGVKINIKKGIDKIVISLYYGCSDINAIKDINLLKELKHSSDSGNVDSMLFYGLILLREEKGNKEKAIKYLQKSMKKGNKYASVFYKLIQFSEDKRKNSYKLYKDSNLMFLFGFILSRNKDEHLVEKGIKCINYAEMLLKGGRLKMNKKKAAHYFKILADKGHVQSMYYYGRMLYHGDGIEINKEEAVKYFEASSNFGNKYSKFYYGQMLLNGLVIKTDKLKAAQYLKESADFGIVSGMFLYGMMLYDGDGIPKNKKEAAKYLKKASDKNDSESMFYYGEMLFNGDGVPIDKKKAIHYFKKSAYLGFEKSEYKYGEILFNGEEVSPNKEEAVRLFQKLAEKGNSKAIFKYAKLLFKGDSVPVNRKKSISYICKIIEKDLKENGSFYRNIFICLILIIILIFILIFLISKLQQMKRNNSKNAYQYYICNIDDMCQC